MQIQSQMMTAAHPSSCHITLSTARVWRWLSPIMWVCVLTIHEMFHQWNWKGWLIWSNIQPSAATPQIDGADIRVSWSGKANYDSQHIGWNWGICTWMWARCGDDSTSVRNEIESLAFLLTTSSSHVNSFTVMCFCYLWLTSKGPSLSILLQ